MRKETRSCSKNVKLTDRTNDMSNSEQAHTSVDSFRIKPWLLCVPNFSFHQSRTEEKGKTSSIDYKNDVRLRILAKGDPAWHCKLIPLKRRQILCLPTFAWDLHEPSRQQERVPQIRSLDETSIYDLTGVPSQLRKTAALIPFEKRKRRRSDGQEQHDNTLINSQQATGESTLKQSRAALISLPISSTSNSSSTQCSTKISPPKETTTTPNLLTVDVKSSLSSARQSENARPLSPPMRIVSVRSLATSINVVPTLDEPLGEGILVEPEVRASGSSPLYIFNPVHRILDSPHVAVSPECSRERAGQVGDWLCDTAETPGIFIRKNCAEETVNEPPSGKNVVSNKQADAPSAVMAKSRGAELNIFFEDEVEQYFQIESDASSAENGRRSPVLYGTTASDSLSAEIIKRESTGGLSTLNDCGDPKSGKTAAHQGGALHLPTRLGSLQCKTYADNQNSVKIRKQRRTSGTFGRGTLFSCSSPQSDASDTIVISDSHSSPFEDSDHSDVSFEEFDAVRNSPEPSVNFTADVIKQLETVEEVPSDTAATLLVSQATGSNGDPVATSTQQTNSVDRSLPKLHIRLSNVKNKKERKRQKSLLGYHSFYRVSHGAISTLSGDLSRTDVTCSDSQRWEDSWNRKFLKYKKRQEKLNRERKIKVTESMIVVTQMQLMSYRDKMQFPNKALSINKLCYLEELVEYFRKNEFSKEPLNRSILNAMADWLSPSPSGQLPPLKLRTTLLKLIKSFTLTTPTHIFKTSSIESVLKLLINHPEETSKNKWLEWAIMCSLRKA